MVPSFEGELVEFVAWKQYCYVNVLLYYVLYKSGYYFEENGKTQTVSRMLMLIADLRSVWVVRI